MELKGGILVNLGELKREIKGLGFSDEDTMQEYLRDSVLLPAINRAVDFIGYTVRPIVASVTVRPEGAVYETFDMKVLAPGFSGFYGKPVIKSGGVYAYLNDFFIEGESKIVLRGDLGVDITVYYKKVPERITAETEDDFEMELDGVVQPLVPLLASYFIWLDDEVQKAAMYYNLYDDMKNQILAQNQRPVSVRFMGGVSWRN